METGRAEVPRMHPEQVQLAMPFLDSLPYPAMWIVGDHDVRWANAAARARAAGRDQSKCYRLAYGYDSPCVAQGEVCPKLEAERCGHASSAMHTHLDAQGIGLFRVTAIPVSDAGVIEFHIPLPVDCTLDSLTGLLSRRFAPEVLSRNYELMGRLHQPVSLLMLDLDHFKNVNDTHGHEAGDAVLAAVGRAVLATVRKTDIAVRWGGEEFLILLPGVDRTSAAAQAQRLNAAIRTLRIPYKDAVLRITVSIGVWGDEPLIPLNEAIECSDAALYHAKAAGRNRSLVAVPMNSPSPAKALED